jgi:predicted membrane protein
MKSIQPKRALASLLLLLCGVLFSIAAIAPAAAAQTGPVGRVAFFHTTTIESSDTVTDVLCIACSVRVRGHVTGDIVTIGGGLVSQGIVDGDVVAIGGGVEVRSEGRLGGDVFSLGGYIDKVSGGTIARDSFAVPYVIIPGQLNPTAIGSAGLAVINVLLVALAYAALRLRRVEATARALHDRAGSVVFAGLLAVVFFYAANSLCTRLGRSQAIPEIILGAIFVAVAAAGATGVGFWAASFPFPNTQGAATTLAGILTLTFLEFVPLFGFAVALAGFVLSLGAAVVTAFGSRAVEPPAPPPGDPIS